MKWSGAAVAAWLACATFSAAAGAADVEVLQQTGPADRRFNIAVLGDGYRAEDQGLLRDNARAIIDYLFGVSPLREYAQFFNVKLVHVISKDDGADDGSYGAVRDTALGAHFNCDGIDRLLCIDDAQTQLAAARDVPEYNFAIVLVNDPKYGGSGGPVCVSSSNEQSFEVLAHEVGHSLAGLADEYSYEGNQPSCDATNDCPEANVTLRTLREQIKWKSWIDTSTPIPTPATSYYQDVLGLFEGGRYKPVGVYRPRQDCKMRDLGVPYCSVCSEQFVRSFWSADNVSMIEETTPPVSNVTLDGCDPLELAITSPPISPSTYEYAWSVDGVDLPSRTRSARIWPARLGAGEHDVAVAIQDATELVRSDPHALLHDSFHWRVAVTRDDCAESSGGGSAAGGTSAGGSSVAGGGGVDPAGGAALGGGGGIDRAGSGGGGSGSAAAGGATTAGAGGQGSSEAGVGGTAGAPPGGNVGGSAGGQLSTAGAEPSPGGASTAGDAATGGANQNPSGPHDNKSCGCAVPGGGKPDALPLLGLAGAIVLWRRRGRL